LFIGSKKQIVPESLLLGCDSLSGFPEKSLQGCDKLSGVPESFLQG